MLLPVVVESIRSRSAILLRVVGLLLSVSVAGNDDDCCCRAGGGAAGRIVVVVVVEASQLNAIE